MLQQLTVSSGDNLDSDWIEASLLNMFQRGVGDS